MAKFCFESIFGRYFGGRSINVRFYPEAIYNKNNLESFEI
jgi:hypothetical protein